MDAETPESQLVLSQESKIHLESTRKWTLFLSIVGFVFIGIMVVFGLSFGAFMRAFDEISPSPGFNSAIFGVIYIIFALIYFFPVLYLYRFSRYMKQGIRTNETHIIDQAFRNLKAHYTFMGILIIIMLGLYFFAGVIGAFIALLS